MAFTIPNELDAFNANQAEVDSKDIDIMVAGAAQTGVVSGCAVTQQTIPNVGVTVAAGTIIYNKTWATVAGGNLALSAPDATNPRFDLIVSNSSGTISAVTGTPSAEPVFPAIPASSVVLAAVYVPANETTILNNRITDKRVIVTEPRFFSGDIQPQGNITGSPGNVASKVDFGTRSMNAIPAAGEIENRLAILLAATGRLGLDVNNPGKLIKLSLTGATQYSHLIDIDHSNNSGVGDSSALYIKTNASAGDTAAAVAIRNVGVADSLYLGAEGPTTGSGAGALGLGVDVNRQYGTNNENNGNRSCTGILITNWTSSTNNGVCITMNNFNAACLAPSMTTQNNGAALNAAALTAAGDGNLALVVRDSVPAVKFSVTYSGVLTAEKASFVAQPRARVYAGAATTLTTGTPAAIAFNSEDTDVGGMHDNATNNTRITIPTGGGGTYILAAGIEFAANAAGIRQINFLKNGATNLAFATSPNLGAADVPRISLTTTVDLVAGDYVEVQGYQNSGGNLNTGTGSAFAWLSATKVN